MPISRSWTGTDCVERHGNIQRLDRILEADNDSVNRYKASKQADVLMLFYLLSADELRELFARWATASPRADLLTVDYYLHRTSHGSTLSGVVHAWVLARGDRERAMRYFQQVLAWTSPTSRAAPPPKASTPRRWPAASTCCSAA